MGFISAFKGLKRVEAGGCAVEGVGLQPLDCWNLELEIR